MEDTTAKDLGMDLEHETGWVQNMEHDRHQSQEQETHLLVLEQDMVFSRTLVVDPVTEPCDGMQRMSHEAELINSHVPDACPYCGSTRFVKYGITKNRISRFLCKDCAKTFTPVIGTIFEHHKIPIVEWTEFCKGMFKSVNEAGLAKGKGGAAGFAGGKNALTTSRYWLKKLFLLLEGIQDSKALSGLVWIGELCVTAFGIAVATDGQNSVMLQAGAGRPSAQSTYDTLCRHIAPGSTLVYDRRKGESVEKLIHELPLAARPYDMEDIKAKAREPQDIDELIYGGEALRRNLEKYLGSISGLKQADLQGYLDMYSFVANSPDEEDKKADMILNLAFSNHKELRYRDFYSKAKEEQTGD